MSNDNAGMLTFGGHLDVMRKMLFRIIYVVLAFGIFIFCFKQTTFNFLLAPSRWDFLTYRIIEQLCNAIGMEFHFEEYHIRLISTDLSGQFMAHLSTSVYLALLCSSPYIVYELFKFISPALYENERKYSVVVVGAIYGLFIIGVAMSYYVIFPISFRFLGTYQVDAAVDNQITLASYLSTFTTLTFMMGLVFQVPVIAFFLAKLEIIEAETMRKYRRHAILIISIIAAVITPPDVFTLVLVALPIYLLYEVAIRIAKIVNRRKDTKLSS